MHLYGTFQSLIFKSIPDWNDYMYTYIVIEYNIYEYIICIKKDKNIK